MNRSLLLAALVAALLAPVADAQIPLTAATYAQDFNTLASAGTSSTVPVGWAFVETGTNANTTYTANDGGSNAGDTYSYGTGSNPDRAYGGLQSSTLFPTIGAQFQNATPDGVLTEIAVAYTGEEWRLGFAGRTDMLIFQYSVDATSLSTGAWTSVAALNFTTPVTTTAGAKDGNAAANRTAIASTITGLSVAPGETIWFRWVDFNAPNSDDGLAVDDFSVTPTVVTDDELTVAQDVTGRGGWRMLSAPVHGVTVGELADLSLVQGIADEFPALAPNILTAFDGTNYLEPAGEATVLEPGRGFIWYLRRRAFDPDPADTNGESESTGLPLDLTTTGIPVVNSYVRFVVADHPGGLFFLLGNPFPNGFDLAGIGTSNSSIQGGVVYAFSPAVRDYVTLDADDTDAVTDVVGTWQGFMVEMALPFSVPLTFTFDASAQTGNVPLVALTSGAPPVAGLAVTPRLDLLLTAADAAGNEAVDAVTRLVLRPDARAGWDAYDGTELGGLGAQEARIAFRGKRAGAEVWKGIEARPAPQADRALPLDLRVRGFAGEATATLTWTGLETLPAGMTVELRDRVGNRRVVLAPGASYTFTASDTGGWAERLRLRLIPAAAAVAAALAAPPSVAVAPNPVVGRAEVRVTLPVAERVVVAVYDALGRRVAVLHDGVLEAATTALVLDASVLSPGVYVVRVAGETFGETRRMTVVR
jgi:hypothetical protein